MAHECVGNGIDKECEAAGGSRKLLSTHMKDRNGSFNSFMSSRGLTCIIVFCTVMVLISLQESTNWNFVSHSMTDNKSDDQNFCANIYQQFLRKIFVWKYLKKCQRTKIFGL